MLPYWFTAMTMQNVAYVRAVGQAELIFTFLTAILIYPQQPPQLHEKVIVRFSRRGPHTSPLWSLPLAMHYQPRQLPILMLVPVYSRPVEEKAAQVSSSL